MDIKTIEDGHNIQNSQRGSMAVRGSMAWGQAKEKPPFMRDFAVKGILVRTSTNCDWTWKYPKSSGGLNGHAISWRGIRYKLPWENNLSLHDH